MSLTPGTRIGPYEITAPLGEGGMGVVFRARDTQLLRDVALKLLPGDFANDPDRLGRFQQEAQVLASLNHPNIAQVYGFQQHGSSGAIVMELVEGETLAEHLRRGPLSINQTISVAKQIIDALGEAHKRGIVHRDLKPANVNLTPDGKVKVLDFGLAKVLANEDPAADLSNSPTMMSGSVVGVIMGTAAYMSPEQARGGVVDARTDIWAFGCVLYEMLTGKPAFIGGTVTDIIAKVIEGQPNWDLLPVETPFWIRTLLVSTLTKDRHERLQQIDDARVFIKVADMPKPAVTPAPSVRGSRFMIAALAAVLIAALVPASLYFLRTSDGNSAIRFEMPAQGADNLVISPDGQSIAYVAPSEGKSVIWIRQLGKLTGRPLSGTENGGGLFWSPDSHYLGFFADGKLKKINVSGGPATTLAATNIPAPGSWSREGVILFSTLGNGGVQIARISESGGAVTPVVTPDPAANRSYVLPQFLPDGRFLYIATGGGPGPSQDNPRELYASSLDGAAPVRVMSGVGLFGRYTPPGYLVFVRERALMAQRFNSNNMSLEGEPITIAEGVGAFSVSEQGTLVYGSARVLERQLVVRIDATQLRWFDRSGKPGASIGMPGRFSSLRLSPDGHQVAVDPSAGPNRDIWVIDLDRGVPNRLTFDPAQDMSPRWSPDGKRIVFTSTRLNSSAPKIFLRSSVGIGGDEPLSLPTTEANMVEIADDWSPDGMYIVFVRGALDNSHVDIWVMPMSGHGKPFPYVQSSSFRQGASRVSPNGRWMAYMTNESGTYQIVVRPFPDPNQGKWQITAQGGIYPTWRGDGRELYYLALDGKLMVVPVKDGPNFEPGQPTVLFQTPLTIPSLPADSRYDVSADGQRFLFLAPASPPASDSSGAGTDSGAITTIVNWTAALRQK